MPASVARPAMGAAADAARQRRSVADPGKNLPATELGRDTLVLSSPASVLALQRSIGNQATIRLRSRLAGSRPRPPSGAERGSPVQRHSDAALQEQIEKAKQIEEAEQTGIQRAVVPPRTRLVQRHLVPKSEQAADFQGVPTAAMAEKLRKEIADRTPQSRAAILGWLNKQNLEKTLKEQKVAQINKLEWKTSLQRLGGVPAKVDGATGTVQLFTRQADFYDATGAVDTDFVQVTMIHEAFHALSANHTGFQDDNLFPEITESLDEAFTEKYAAEAFHLAFGDAAKYTSNYWLPNNRWTGDLAEVVEQLSGLSRDDVMASYLQNPAVVTQAYVANMLTAKDAWDTLKGQDRARSEAKAKDQITEAVAKARAKNLGAGVPAVAPVAHAGPGGAGVPAVAPAAHAGLGGAAVVAPGNAVDQDLQAIYDFVGTFPIVRKAPKPDLQQKQELEAKFAAYNQTHPKDPLPLSWVEFSPRYTKWKESTIVTPVNNGHLKTAAEMLGLPTSDHSGINLVIPTMQSALQDTISSIPQGQRTTAASAEFSQATIGTVMGETGGDQSRKAADILDAMGGGGYEATTATIFLHPKNSNSLPHYVHEVGHYVQHGEQGYFQGAKGADQQALKLTTVLDYHNIVRNENPYHLANADAKGIQGTERQIRFRYVGSEKDTMGKVTDLVAKGNGLAPSATLLEQLKKQPYCTDIDRAMLDEVLKLMDANVQVYAEPVRSLIFANLSDEWHTEYQKKK